MIKVLSLLLLPALVVGQCANPMPSGACCEDDGFFTEADPEVPLLQDFSFLLISNLISFRIMIDSRRPARTTTAAWKVR